ARRAVRAATHRHRGQRLSARDRTATHRDSLGAEHDAVGLAPAEEPEPGRVQHLGRRQLLAALLHQHALPADPASLRDTPWTSGGALPRHALAGWRALDLLDHAASARSAGV